MSTITERAVMGMFFERLEQNPGAAWLARICAMLDSNQDTENYAWLGMVPQMSEFTGQKKYSQLRQTPWNVTNVEYQGGIAIPKKHILYDKTGQVRVRVNELADRAMAHWASIVATLIINGESTACYDNQFFFDTDHSEGDSGTQDNDISVDISALPVTNHGSTTDPSVGEFIHAVMKAVEQILAFKDDKGEYVNENMTDFHVMIPTSFMTPSLGALSSNNVDRGDSNLFITQDNINFTIQATPRLNSWTTKFAVFAAEGDQKPILCQQRIPNEADSGYDANGMLVNTLWLDSEHCKKENECLMSVETERAAAYGDWKKSCLVTMT